MAFRRQSQRILDADRPKAEATANSGWNLQQSLTCFQHCCGMRCLVSMDTNIPAGVGMNDKTRLGWNPMAAFLDRKYPKQTNYFRVAHSVDKANRRSTSHAKAPLDVRRVHASLLASSAQSHWYTIGQGADKQKVGCTTNAVCP